jgi:hypothetical protein
VGKYFLTGKLKGVIFNEGRSAGFPFEEGKIREKVVEKDFEKAFKEDFGDHPGDA